MTPTHISKPVIITLATTTISKSSAQISIPIYDCLTRSLIAAANKKIEAKIEASVK